MKTAGKVYAFFAAILIIFQTALAFGAPWGVLTQGGFNTGTLPPSGRVIAGFSVILLIVLTHVVLTHARLIKGYGPASKKWAIYLTLAIAALSAVANIMTPSAPERMMGAPIATILLISLIVVIVKGRQQVSPES